MAVEEIILGLVPSFRVHSWSIAHSKRLTAEPNGPSNKCNSSWIMRSGGRQLMPCPKIRRESLFSSFGFVDTLCAIAANLSTVPNNKVGGSL